jgi:hypothetical protein
MWAAGLVVLLTGMPLRSLAAWRCRSAARRLPDLWRSGTARLPRWPGVRDTGAELAVRRGSGSFRPWALGVGLLLSGYLAGRSGGEPSAFDLALSLAPAICAVTLSALWGPSGWLLSVDSRKSQAVLTIWRPLRRGTHSSVSLPTVQGVALEGGRRAIVMRRARGGDWKLGVPGAWPPELAEALAARVAGLAGVDFRREPGEDTGRGTRSEGGPAAEEVST